MKRTVQVRVVNEVCLKCDKFKINNNGVHLIDGIRGWTIFDPHCEYEDVCRNLLNMIEQNNKEPEKTVLKGGTKDDS